MADKTIVVCRIEDDLTAEALTAIIHAEYKAQYKLLLLDDDTVVRRPVRRRRASGLIPVRVMGMRRSFAVRPGDTVRVTLHVYRDGAGNVHEEYRVYVLSHESPPPYPPDVPDAVRVAILTSALAGVRWPAETQTEPQK